MNSIKTLSLLAAALCIAPNVFAGPSGGSFSEGLNLYKAGRFSEATDAFDKAARTHDHESEAKDYLDRIRKETVERIRSRALTGIAKSNWQSKYYFINTVQNHVQVGISSQELFERGSLNFRPGALEALQQLATTLQKADSGRVEIQIISEIPMTPADQDQAINAQQEAQVFSYLSLAANDELPKFNQ